MDSSIKFLESFFLNFPLVSEEVQAISLVDRTNPDFKYLESVAIFTCEDEIPSNISFSVFHEAKMFIPNPSNLISLNSVINENATY